MTEEFEEFLECARDRIEQQVDHMIATEPDAVTRALMVRDRQRIVDFMMDKIEILNLRYQLAEAKAGQRPPDEPLH